MSKEKRYYIAYGSNLNVEQMMRRCPGAKPIGTAMLEHNILYFRGSGSGYYLTIEPKIGSKVPVAVWEVTPEDEEALDRYEGYPRFYFKYDYTLKVRLLDEETTKELRCFAYVMTEGRRVGLPTNYYLTTCMKGYRDFGFDTKILETTEIKIRTCPICGTAYRGHPAISRTDNETPICSDCGTRESLQDIGISDEEIEKIIEIIHRNVDRKL